LVGGFWYFGWFGACGGGELFTDEFHEKFDDRVGRWTVSISQNKYGNNKKVNVKRYTTWIGCGMGDERLAVGLGF
jgi:hypothetical protein